MCCRRYILKIFCYHVLFLQKDLPYDVDKEMEKDQNLPKVSELALWSVHSIKWANEMIPNTKLLSQRTLSGSSQICLVTLTCLQGIRRKATNLTDFEVTESFISVSTGMLRTGTFKSVYSGLPQSTMPSVVITWMGLGCSNQYLVDGFPK